MHYEQIIGICAAITGAMMAFGKHVMPVFMKWFGYRSEVDKLKEKVVLLQTNHMTHFQADLVRLEKAMNGNFKETFNRLSSAEQLLARIDERTK